MSYVRILSGTYHYKPVSGVFKIAKDHQVGKRGGFITVMNNGSLSGGEKARILVSKITDFEYLDSNSEPLEEYAPASSQVDAEAAETDDEAMDRIATRFSILDEMSLACINGNIRAMIVSGPPGVGKSFGVESQLEKYSLFDIIADKKARYEIVKGAMTPLGLYAQLYKFSDPKSVLVFDDADGVFADELSINILKAALDSGKRRKIFWNSDSAMLRREGIPDCFEFRGSIIFITNLNFANTRSPKLRDHLEALQSRCHFLDLTINNERDKMLRILQVHRDASKNQIGGLFAEYDFAEGVDQEILDFMWENRQRLREVSLRMSLKIADLIRINPGNWKTLTENTCMRAA